MPIKKSDIDLDKTIALARSAGIATKFFENLPLFSRKMASTTYDLARIAVITSVLRAVESVSLDEVKANLDREALKGLIKSSSRTSYRTALLNTFNTGVYQQAIENDDDNTFFEYDAIDDSRTRPSHGALNGVIKKVTSDFWTTHTPPLGYNCRCTLKVLTEGQANRKARADGRSRTETGNKKINDNIREIKKNDQNLRGKKIEAGADDGFKTSNPRDVTSTLDNILKDRVKDLDPILKRPFNESIRRKESEARTWYEKFKDQFTN